VGVAVVVHADVGVCGRVGAGENDLTLAVGLHGIGQHDDRLGVRGKTQCGIVEVLLRVDAQHCLPDVGVVPQTKKPT
jgi:hypothetical protein